MFHRMDNSQDWRYRLCEYGFTARDVEILSIRREGGLGSLPDIKDLIDSYGYDYDWSEEYVVRAASISLQSEKLTCINAALLAYVLLGALGDENRVLLAIHRRDPNNVECGHVVAVGKVQGRFFALGKSNYAALNEVYGPYNSVHEVALAFARAYLSMNFSPLYYGLFRAEDCCDANELICGKFPLNKLCDFMVSNYQYAYSVTNVGHHSGATCMGA